MKITRVFLTAVLIITLIFVLAACGASGSVSGKSGGSAGAEAEQDPNAPYVIEYYMLANSASYEANDVMNEINKIIQPKFNATVNITMIAWADWFAKVNSDIRAGKKVDLVFTADWWQYMDSIASGYFLPLDDLLNRYSAQTRAQLGETFVSGCKVDGVLYGIPTNKELAGNGGFVYNKTLLDKYGLKVDTGWKKLRDWEPLLKVIKEKEPDVCPLLTELTDVYWKHLNFPSSLPCELVFDGNANNDQIEWRFDYPWYMEELRTARDFYLKGYIPEVTLDNDEWYNTHITQGNFFLLTAPLKPGKGKSSELMAALVNPGIEYDEFETYPLLVTTRNCGGSMLAIPRTSGNPDKAMQFINEMHTNAELTNLLAWGIEGKQYTVTSENPRRVKPIENNSWTQAVLVWTLGNVFNTYLSNVEPEDKYELLKATKEGIPEHIANGYRFNPAEYQDKITIIENIIYEYKIPIFLGSMDPDKGVAAMRAEIEAAGFEEVKAAVISDFRRWLNKSQ